MKYVWIMLLVFAVCSCSLFEATKKHTGPVYHWEGTLYRGLGEEIHAGAKLELVGYRVGDLASGRNIDLLATGTTDEKGHFKLEYNHDDSHPITDEDRVQLEVNGSPPVMVAPWHTNVERDVAETDHGKILIYIRPTSDLIEKDTLFLTSFFSPSDLLSNNVKFNETKTSAGVIARFMRFTPIYETQIMIKYRRAGSFDFSPTMIRGNFAVGIDSIDRIYSAYHSDSSDLEQINTYQMNVRGWPFTDTLILNI